MARRRGAVRTDGLDDAVSTRLRHANQRVTANRKAIVGALSAAPRPMTIPEILDSPGGRGLAQSSVYRNLVVLEQAGLVHRVVTDGEFALYELAEDLTEHHHHLICGNCGTVEDVPASAGLEQSVAAAAEQIARSTGFHTQRHRVDLVGLCSRCS
jgi:Fur family transcriptional regulator, ferric uptake regulator